VTVGVGIGAFVGLGLVFVGVGNGDSKVLPSSVAVGDGTALSIGVAVASDAEVGDWSGEREIAGVCLSLMLLKTSAKITANTAKLASPNILPRTLENRLILSLL